MVPLNMTYLHCLQHSLFEHLFNLYLNKKPLFFPSHLNDRIILILLCFSKRGFSNVFLKQDINRWYKGLCLRRIYKKMNDSLDIVKNKKATTYAVIKMGQTWQCQHV